MLCGGCFIIRFIVALSADLFWKQCIKRATKIGLMSDLTISVERKYYLMTNKFGK